MIGWQGVDMAFGGQQILRDFTLLLPEDQDIALMGPSGGGKTTLLRLLAGLEHPDAGQVWGFGGRGIAYQFQEDRLLPWYTVRRNLSLFSAEDPEEWLRAVGLEGEGEKYPAELSGGMRRRVALARALAHPGGVLLLDEPLKELDAALRGRMVDLIRERQRGRQIVLVTHNPVEARTLCRRIITLAGTPLTIQNDEEVPHA